MLKVKSSSTNAKLRLWGLLALPAAIYCIPKGWIMDGHAVCIFHNLTGRDCYGCGMTRALFSLLHFDPAAAWEYNRLAVIVAPLIGYLYLKELVKTFGEL